MTSKLFTTITDDYTAEAGQLLAIYGADRANPQPLADWIHANATDSEAGVIAGRDGELVATVRLDRSLAVDAWRVEEALDPRAEVAVGEVRQNLLHKIFGWPLVLATVRSLTEAREPEAE